MTDDEDRRDDRARATRAAAKGWLQTHPVPGAYRQFVLYVLTEWIDADCTFFVGVREVAFRCGMTKPKADQVIAELIDKGVIVVLNPDRKRGERRVCRLDYEMCAEVYPPHVRDTSGKKGKAGNVVTHSETDEAGNSVTHSNGVENVEVGNGESVKWVTDGAKVGNTVTPSIEHVNLEQLTPTTYARASGPDALEKSDVHQKSDPPSNDAVKKKSRGPPTPERHHIRARGA